MLSKQMSNSDIMKRLIPILLSAMVVLPFTLLIENHPIDLEGPIALAAYYAAESGGTALLPLLVVGMTIVLLSRNGISWKQRGSALALIVMVLSLFLGGGAYLNEHAIKPFFAIPRPCTKELAEFTNGKSDLGISAEQFYAIPDTLGRRNYMEETLKIGGPPMSDKVREHWIHETGYSFPSGHSFSSMMVATFFMALGLGYFTQARRWACLALVLWALAVCYSRPILRLHSAVDVCFGALEGIIVGFTAFLVFRQLIERQAK